MDIIKINSREYPEMLKQIYDPPRLLYAVGNKELLKEENAIAIIGSRKYTEYGKKATEYFSYNLAKAGITIVSGLAKGIDSFSHIGTLSAKGKTIAVIGSGLDKIYPKENIELARQIVKRGGLIISEYSLGTEPKPNHFPERNRIISGLSKGVIVTEAREKSGALITVEFALDQGRDVLAVPGNIKSINSVGTNHMIKEGARIITNIKDILQLDDIFRKI